MGGGIVTTRLQSAAPFFLVDENRIGVVCEIDGDPAPLIQNVLKHLNVSYTVYSPPGGPRYLILCFPKQLYSQAQNKAVLGGRETGRPVLVIESGDYPETATPNTGDQFAGLSKVEILARLFSRSGPNLNHYIKKQATDLLGDAHNVFEGISFTEVPLRKDMEPFSVSTITGELKPVRHASGFNGERDGAWYFSETPEKDEETILIGEGAFYRLKRSTSSESYFQKSAKQPSQEVLNQREKLGHFLTRLGGCPEQLKAFSALQKMQNINPAEYAWRDDVRFVIDCVVGLEDAIFVAGEYKDSSGLIEAITIRTAFGETVALDPLMHRPAGAKNKFCALVPVKRGGRYNTQIRGQVKLASGMIAPIISPYWAGDLYEARTKILSSLPPACLTPDILGSVIGPSLHKAYETYIEPAKVSDIVEFDHSLDEPDCSLIIPLYKEYGFIKAQLQNFFFDEDFKNVEVIYVLDRPEDAAAVEHLIKGLLRIYKVPVRLVVNSKNSGFAGASNLGASVASSDLLLFFNSDVVPTQSSWISNWISQHKSVASVGASGPRLLYADGSLQHAGLYSEQDLLPWYTNHHYFKGYPGDFPGALENRSVQGVTGACLMMDKDLFEELDGFCDEFVVGDFEDSDLCLKALNAGRENHYFGDICLYHFERASMTQNQAYSKSGAVRYNGWLHTQKWQGLLPQLAQFGAG